MVARVVRVAGIGSLDEPAALVADNPLSNRVGAGLDPCGVLQAEIDLAPQSGTEIVCFLGQAATDTEDRALTTHYSKSCR